jgi:two-component system chemotaxis sensor kinase CheA
LESSLDRVVFVVDDDPGVRRLIATGLRYRFGVHAMPMAGADEALTWARTVRPILILTDLMMPDIDGAELTRRVKSDPTTGDIPIVVMSGGGPEARERALAAGGARTRAHPPGGDGRVGGRAARARGPGRARSS